MAGDRRVDSGRVPAQSATHLRGARGRALECPLHRSPAAADGLTTALPRDSGVPLHYGYRRMHVLLRREGWMVNHKRVYRLYRDEGLGLRAETTEAPPGRPGTDTPARGEPRQ
jgi:hypothetical protein